LVFWGGIQNGFWAFDHNPEQYAKSIKIPTLLMWGAKDKSVIKADTNKIFANLAGQKHLVVFPDAGHEDYRKKYRAEWDAEVSKFLQEYTTQ
jgi:pimeloyl-ACP methyl ester carboxylesterase